MRADWQGEGGGHVQPVYGVGLEPGIGESIVDTVEGYRGMKPVRIGNQAHEHLQHDVYGQIVLPLVQAFYDQRLLRPGTIEDFHALEKVGERAFAMHDQTDAGLWEFRTIARVHTYSSVMCWAACDRLAKAADHLGLQARADVWRQRAAAIRERIEAETFLTDEGRFAASFGGRELDASLLQLTDLGFLDAHDPRQVATFDAIERDLKKGPFLFRYVEPDDFGEPETAFNFCTFWFIEALHQNGRVEEARAIFEEMLARRTQAGLLSEDISVEDGELWGNYPQTYSLVGIINCAVMLSRSWTDVRCSFWSRGWDRCRSEVMSRLIVVSNRVSAPTDPAAGSAGGLAMALSAALRKYDGLWFGWSGETIDSFTGVPRRRYPVGDDDQTAHRTSVHERLSRTAQLMIPTRE